VRDGSEEAAWSYSPTAYSSSCHSINAPPITPAVVVPVRKKGHVVIGNSFQITTKRPNKKPAAPHPIAHRTTLRRVARGLRLSRRPIRASRIATQGYSIDKHKLIRAQQNLGILLPRRQRFGARFSRSCCLQEL